MCVWEGVRVGVGVGVCVYVCLFACLCLCLLWQLYHVNPVADQLPSH